MIRITLLILNIVNIWYLLKNLGIADGVYTSLQQTYTVEGQISLIYYLGYVIMHTLISISLILLSLSGDTVIVVDEQTK